MARTRGGRKLRRFLKSAKRAQFTSRSVQVGFFSTAKYPDGTQVASVAAWQEFGTELRGREHIPERPFFRQAIKGAEEPILEVMKASIDPKTMVLDSKTAGLVGETMKGRVQESIVKLDDPPNALSTIDAKGSSNPLVDTGVLRNSVTWAVKD